MLHTIPDRLTEDHVGATVYIAERMHDQQLFGFVVDGVGSRYCLDSALRTSADHADCMKALHATMQWSLELQWRQGAWSRKTYECWDVVRRLDSMRDARWQQLLLSPRIKVLIEQCQGTTLSNPRCLMQAGPVLCWHPPDCIPCSSEATLVG